MKRGEKLKLETAQSEADLVDFGMRYDLTVPLCRYYANHANDLPSPFKALQMGNVWRADRPQRGRYRQFMQCDIDILGEPSNLAEIELILATTTTLGKLGFKNFEIRINERRILKAMAAYSGFAEEEFDTVFIILDKMDKIGLEGVAEELAKEGYAQEAIDKYLSLFTGVEQAEDGISYLADTLGDYLDAEIVQNMKEIASAVNATKIASFELVFDRLWYEACLTIQELFLRLRFRSLAEAAAAADVTTRWLETSPEKMFRLADFPSDLSVSSCF